MADVSVTVDVTVVLLMDGLKRVTRPLTCMTKTYRRRGHFRRQQGPWPRSRRAWRRTCRMEDELGWVVARIEREAKQRSMENDRRRSRGFPIRYALSTLESVIIPCPAIIRWSHLLPPGAHTSPAQVTANPTDQTPVDMRVPAVHRCCFVSEHGWSPLTMSQRSHLAHLHPQICEILRCSVCMAKRCTLPRRLKSGVLESRVGQGK
ncbi:hypothetical protein K466DRAFT_184978 [Polyporus arcularius HHB13444]|uniref:Uncharacterized protein n=1 Tax=Polyporus arcularius HHB13444 TaxID=1314778 RepID=A0A5C3P8A6_9APHY|nr:hypothetical protein K466DRAFT_184978 [Polyporus arcularius HHB13444]